MPQRALYDLAESVLGRAPEMHWSMDEGIARRETSRLFQRLYNGDTTSDAALEVFMIGMMTKLRNSLAVIEERYNSLIVTLTHEEQNCCPTLNEFFEFFTNLSAAADYSLSEDISRKELAPLFAACRAHVLSANDCQDAVFDYAIAKRDIVLTTLQVTVQKLNAELSEVLKVRAEKKR
jgi:hypothetical protein